MEMAKVAEIARNYAVMVRVQGPDPKGLKMRNQAFHQHESGKTTLSASGILLSDSFVDPFIWNHLRDSNLRCSSTFVFTPAFVVEPFLPVQHRRNPAEPFSGLISGARIDVLTEFSSKAGHVLTRPERLNEPAWMRAELLALVDVPSSSMAIKSLIEARGGSHEYFTWEIGWNMASLNDRDIHSIKDTFQGQVGTDDVSASGGTRSLQVMALSNTRMALLGLPTISINDLPLIDVSLPRKRGDLLLVIGSPFGVLSPLHFFNRYRRGKKVDYKFRRAHSAQLDYFAAEYSVSAGTVANCYPPCSSDSSILMADIRCLPGMEGGPVLDNHAALVGLLTRPVRQWSGGAEIQLVITWNAIESAWKAQLSISQGEKVNLSHLPSVSPLDRSLLSVVLLTMEDGAWASGVVLNCNGLVLTNAHFLEPWRFVRTLSNADQSTSQSLSIISENTRDQEKKKHLVQTAYSFSNACKRIDVRLDHMNPSIWCSAHVVYISKGPLDVALLQLDSVPDHLHPIVPDVTYPLLGSNAYVIGHGLLGPHTKQISNRLFILGWSQILLRHRIQIHLQLYTFLLCYRQQLQSIQVLVVVLL